MGTAAPLPCEPGYYVPSRGSKSKFDCIPCEPGKYCSGSQGSGATADCFPGYFCTGGASTGDQNITGKGYYSKAGSWAPTPCPLKTYQPKLVYFSTSALRLDVS